MSEAELQTILAENEKLSAEVELTKNIIKVSEACADLQKYMDETNDPLIASKAAEDMTNPWTEKTKNAGCNLL
eukprot:CAMPEP_0205824158 /NCGR_PEP_ID=MMETSP0206-20130828/19692_1 /ASSEMBLY_ACC=CAM_ASM_000279 /TAXON_ID=36767 /ORGANISM="Euplotes focardii, Strain TN1" /LENGTH=72 /DNA_ID=CAMNT_0053122015 /DNA_START=45 /DNA_END=263 /DNA_ORIENTATION=-